MSRASNRQSRGLPTFRNAEGSRDTTVTVGVVHGTGTIASSGGGVIASNIPLDPSTLTSTDWADFSGLYDEFRVVGAKLIIASLQEFSTTAANSLAAIAFDNDSTVAPSSFSQVQQYNTCKYMSSVFVSSSGKPWEAVWYRPTSGRDTTIPWIDVATPSNSPGSIFYYATGLSAGTNYWSYAVELLIQFRGRR